MRSAHRSTRSSLQIAVRSTVERLEGRQLLHAGEDHGNGLEALRVDAGAAVSYTDGKGQVWQADAGFLGGGTDNKSFAVAGTNDPKLFTSRRAGEFAYASPAADGNYTLNLLFSDWVTTAGTRKFNVSAEGQTILTNFDIAGSGGAQKALIKSFDVTVTGGVFNLAFAKVIGNPVLSAFELVPVSAPSSDIPAAPESLFARPASSSKILLAWDDESTNETGFEIERSADGVTFTPLATAGVNQETYADENLSPSTRYVYRVRAINGGGDSAWSNPAEGTTLGAAPARPGTTTLRVDAAGNSNFTDALGNVWAKDAGFTGGYANTAMFAVAKTIDDALYATRRTGDFTYTAPVANGDYTLRLLFSDPSTATGQRKFNVGVEGKAVLTNFDIVAEAGSKTALVKTIPITITDGKLDLAFTSVIGNAALSAFELMPAGPATIPASPTALTAAGKPGGLVQLTWQDGSANETGFQIERSAAGGAFAVVATTVANQTGYEDKNLTPGVAYTYRVRSTNSAGSSGASNEASATPAAASPVNAFKKITWSTIKAAPIGRAEALHAVVDGKLYVFAGFSGDAGPVTRADVYDPATNTWSVLPDMPRRLSHAGTAVDGHDIYFAGGYIGTGKAYTQQFGTTEVWKFNIDTKTYTAVRAFPRALSSGGLVVVGRQLHYFGGNDAARKDTGIHLVLDLSDPAADWVEAKPMLTARSHMGYVNFNGLIYAIGGQTGNDEALTAQSVVEIYNPGTNSWTTGKPMPKGVNHISSATFVMGGRILTLGGQTSHGSAIADGYAYDPAANTWTTISSLPTARFSGVAAEIDGAIYFTGGSSQTTTWKGTIG